MNAIPLKAAQDQLADLASRSLAGEEILIDASGQLLRLLPAFDDTIAARRGWGAFAGQIHLPPAYFEPHTDEEIGPGGLLPGSDVAA